MARFDQIDAFNDCIDRLQTGQSIHDCLRAHPDHAEWLRPALEAGLAITRANLAVPSGAKARVRTRVLEASAVQPQRLPNWQRFGWRTRLLAAALLITALGVIALLFGQPDEKRLHVVPLSPTVTETITPTVTLSPTAPLTNTPRPSSTATATPSSTPPQTNTPRPTRTASLTATQTPSPTPRPSSTPRPTSTLTHTPRPTAVILPTHTFSPPPTEMPIPTQDDHGGSNSGPSDNSGSGSSGNSGSGHSGEDHSGSSSDGGED